MKNFKEKYGPWALVTGASSGIGKEFAVQLARAGLHVVLHGRNLEALDALSSKLRAAYGVQTRIVLADLDIATAWEKIVEETRDLEISLLINNAGYILAGGTLASSPQKEIAMFNANCLAPLALAQHFAPQFARAGRGGIIFTSSIASFVASPFWTQYAATKGYELLLAEAMGAELKPLGVDVQALCPGPVKTNIFKRSGSKIRATFFHLTPEAVVRESLDKLGRKSVVISGLRNKLLVAGIHFIPRSFLTKMNYSVMKNVVSH